MIQDYIDAAEAVTEAAKAHAKKPTFGSLDKLVEAVKKLEAAKAKC